MDLQAHYTITIKNRFNQLSNELYTATESYQHLIQANDETAKKLIPIRKRKKQLSKDPRVEDAREKVKEAFKEYQTLPNKHNHDTLKTAKDNLDT